MSPPSHGLDGEPQATARSKQPADRPISICFALSETLSSVVTLIQPRHPSRSTVLRSRRTLFGRGAQFFE